MLEAVEKNELAARLNQFGLFPQAMRVKFAEELIDLCVRGTDPAVLWNEALRSMLVDAEYEALLTRVRVELLADLPEAIDHCTAGWDNESNPEHEVEPLRTLVFHLPYIFPGDPEIAETATALDKLLDKWVEGHWPEQEDEEPHSEGAPGKNLGNLSGPSERSVFDDLLEGRKDKEGTQRYPEDGRTNPGPL
jgi:hypothetical protein